MIKKRRKCVASQYGIDVNKSQCDWCEIERKKKRKCENIGKKVEKLLKITKKKLFRK